VVSCLRGVLIHSRQSSASSALIVVTVDRH
jgi:hypothetical protein